MAGSRVIAFVGLTLLGAPLAARAQQRPDSTRTRSLCWTPRPAPRCRTVLVTNLGIDLSISPARGTNLLVTEDVGLLVNVSPRSAVGATLSAAVDYSDGFGVGVTLRYRRWTGAGSALDVGIGAGSAGDQGQAVWGLIKYNLGSLLGFALRPEVVGGRPRVSAGIEFGSWPGLVVPALVFGAAAISWASSPPHWM